MALLSLEFLPTGWIATQDLPPQQRRPGRSYIRRRSIGTEKRYGRFQTRTTELPESESELPDHSRDRGNADPSAHAGRLLPPIAGPPLRRFCRLRRTPPIR